ncbi:MAG: transcription antitermination factor NusB [Planctomycetota bacterium]|jgi:16S rRNA (cytosine967-C5)-methyltransferase
MVQPPVSTNPDSARDRITARLVRRARVFPRLGPEPVDTTGLDERDAALAIALDHAVARHWLALVTILDACLSRPWIRLEPVVQAPLLAGAAQMLLLERIPEHAAINEAVRWTKAHGRAGAGGLVNAVLRRLAEMRQQIVPQHDPVRRDELPLPDGRAWRLAVEAFDTDPARRLAQTTSHPDMLIERWSAAHGWTETTRLARHSLVVPPVIVAGAGDDPCLVPHAQEGFAVFTGARGGLRELLDRHPGSRVQDPTAAAPVTATHQLHPDLIVDLCAGRGTKTRQLAEMHPEASVVASDTDDERRGELERVFAADDRVRVVEPAGLIDLAGAADLVVADVPCSNTGVLARRLEARYRFDEQSLGSLLDLQRQVLADCMRLLAPGGTLLYATCSVEPEENEAQARWVARWHDLEPAAMWSRLPAGGPGDPPEEYQDGGFFALLRRR